MKKENSRINQYIQNISTSVGSAIKEMVIKIDGYIEERIETWFVQMETDQRYDNRRLRERAQFGSAIVFIGCIILFIAIPLTGIFSVVKGEMIEHSIKSPNEIMLSLEDEAEFYPEIEVISGEYNSERRQESGV